MSLTNSIYAYKEVIILKLNSDDQTLAESKILLLYILSKVGKAISHNELLELVTSIVDMNYFYFQQFLLDLLEDNYITKYQIEDADIYEITDEGKNAINLTIDIVPGILKLEVDSKFKKNLDTVKDKFSVTSEYTPISEREFTVRCKIVENNTTLFDLHAHAGSREQAKKMVENWTKNAEKLYPKILNIILYEE